MEQGIKEPILEDLERVLLGEGSQYERWEWRIKETYVKHHPTRPAIQFKNGDWEWYWMGKEHRLDGPNSFWNGTYEYWIHGKRLSREEWERNPLRLEWLKNKINGV